MTLRGNPTLKERMLAALRAAGGEPVHRTALVAALWPDENDRPASFLAAPDAIAVRLRLAGHRVVGVRGRGYWLDEGRRRR